MPSQSATRRRIATSISVLYLTLLTALAAYALHSANAHSLPIPNILTALTVALPPLAGLAVSALQSLETSSRLRKHTHRLPPTSHLTLYTLITFLIFETVLATLAGTHIGPEESLGCALETRWQELFRAKNERALRAIQDAFQCCGLRSMRDMAWPFPSHIEGREADACIVRYQDRSGSCFRPWQGEERKVAVLLLVVPIGVFLWKVALYYMDGSQTSQSWLSTSGRQIGSSGVQGAPEIEYRDVEDQTDDESVQNEITRLNSESELATQVEGRRASPRRLIHEQDQWRGE